MTRLADRFLVQGVLGRGGMATVYLVEDETRSDRLALKVLHPHLAHDPAMIDRLRREVAAARRVRHPGALVALDLHELDGTWALTLPYHPGHSLAEHLAEQGPLDPDQVRRLAETLSSVLAAAHHQGVLHRDVSPANVMVDDDGTFQLTDFGLARVRDDRTRHSTGMMGTAGYTAPEVWAGRRTDPRSDLYSLGAVLYEAATGRPAFDRDPMQALQQQLGERWTPLSEAAPELPSDLADTIEALLRQDVELRPSSANDVLDALRGRRAPDLEPALPQRTVSGPVGLPEGDWMVVAKPRRGARRRIRHLRRAARTRGLEASLGADAPERRVVAGIASIAGLPDDALSLSPALVEKDGHRLVDGVDPATAQRIARTAEMAGYEVEVQPRGGNRVREVLSHAPLLIPFLWVAFPFVLGLIDQLAGNLVDSAALVLIPFNVMATILFGMLGGISGASGRKLPLAYGADLTTALAPGVTRSTPTPAPQSDAQALAQRTRDRLSALDQALRESDLPEPAERDLRSTLDGLTAQTERLASRIPQLEEALSEPPAQSALLQQRLERLETRKRAGQDTDPEEEDRLRAAIAAQRQEEALQDSLEGELTRIMASLLEIGAASVRCRRILLAEPESAHRALLQRLQVDAEALESSRSELPSNAEYLES